jgi:hypothetical protein
VVCKVQIEGDLFVESWCVIFYWCRCAGEVSGGTLHGETVVDNFSRDDLSGM